MTLAYTQSIDSCFGENILDRNAVDRMLERTDTALAKIKGWYDTGALPLLRLPEATDDLTALEPVAARFRGLKTVVVLGTGGSSLGGQTLYALADAGFGPKAGAPKLYFLDNVDPVTFDQLLTRVDMTTTGFVVISKSGSTAETLCQFLICYPHLQKTAGYKDRVVVVTEPGENVLRRFAEGESLQVLDHDPKVGGRFSVLSLVGLLPAMIAGLDVTAVRRGALAVLRTALVGKPADCPPAMGAALSLALNEWGKTQTVLMPYVDGLTWFAMWYRQLWAESLGKQGYGTTPIRALGTVDQHSQLQLYLAGPKDKMFTLILGDCSGTGDVVSPQLASDPRLGYLAGRTMGDLLDAEQRATLQSLRNNGCPVRVLNIKRLDEETLGALFMHYMLETIIAAHLLMIDAFDQPAVEEGKILTRQYLSEKKAA
jgi:glucose-6-phosphate isomerase